jgi:hypothetical protein
VLPGVGPENAPDPPPPTTRVPGRWRQIYWIGVGSKTTGLHTKKEFLRLVRGAHPEAIYWRRRGDTIIPEGKLKRNDIEGWIEIADAKWV